MAIYTTVHNRYNRCRTVTMRSNSGSRASQKVAQMQAPLPSRALPHANYHKHVARTFSSSHSLQSSPDMISLLRFKHGQHMPLEFRGTALLDPPGRGIRFAVYPIGRRAGAIVICEVTIDALRKIGGNVDVTADEMMNIFELHKAEFHAITSAKFDEGEYRPTVTAADLPSART
jgi:hypothetical protein